MKKRFYLLLPIYFSFFVGLGIYEIINPPFSTDSTRIGNYEIQVHTTPTVPEVGKDTKIHFLVLDKDEKPVDNFRMGLEIYHNDDLVRAIPPQDHVMGKWDVSYIFEESGNHVIRADLFDLKNGRILPYTFNIGILNFYNNMFTYLIIAGVSSTAGILIAITIFQRKLWTKRR
jgi:hypothetical protein